MMTNCAKMAVVLLLVMIFQSSAASNHKADVGSSGNSQPAVGGEEIVSVLPSFAWIDSSSIRVILPNDVEDIIQLWPAEKVGDMLVPCLFEGKLKEDDTSAIAVSGCQHDDSVRIDIYANFLQGYAVTFSIKNGITEEIGRGNIGKINNVIENQERKTRRKRDLNSGIPPFLLYDVKFGYEESLLAKLGSHEAAQEYIMRVFTHAKVVMQHPSLGTTIRLRAQEPFQFVPGAYWSSASHASLDKAIHAAQSVKQEEAIPVMFFIGTGTLSVSFLRRGCDPRRGVGIQPHQDDLQVAIVRYLHEVGHWIGLPHDEDADSRHGTQCAGTGLMSEQVEPEVRPKIWSSCSHSAFSKWFRRSGSCLKIDSDLHELEEFQAKVRSDLQLEISKLNCTNLELFKTSECSVFTMLSCVEDAYDAYNDCKNCTNSSNRGHCYYNCIKEEVDLVGKCHPCMKKLMGKVCCHFGWEFCCTSTDEEFMATSALYGATPISVPVKLVGGSIPSEGNVYTINSDNNLGPVCDDAWDDRDARVVCRQLGYADGIATSGSKFGSVPNNFSMDDVNCNGSEACVQDCSYNIQDNCGYNEGAGVNCTIPNHLGAGWCYPDVTVHNKLDVDISGEIHMGAGCSNDHYTNLAAGETFRHDRGCWCLVTGITSHFVELQTGKQFNCEEYSSSGTSYGKFEVVDKPGHAHSGCVVDRP